MLVSKLEAQWRQALLAAVIPAPLGLPSCAQLDLSGVWRLFDAEAPVHLQWGLRASTVCLAGYALWFTGGRGTLGRLSEAECGRLLQRAAGLPLIADLVEVTKVVACLAYFDDPLVQARVRGES